MKAYSELVGKKVYYKLSNFDKINGVVGHECVNELIVDRLMTVLGIPHLEYQLIHADVFDAYKAAESSIKESALEFCIRNGWEDYIYQILVVDFLIQNRDRHGASNEVLKNILRKAIRLAPLFGHGLSLLFRYAPEQFATFDVIQDRMCNNFIGSRSTWDNLKLTPSEKLPKLNPLREADREIIMEVLENVILQVLQYKIWQMIWKRWCADEDFWHSR